MLLGRVPLRGALLVVLAALLGAGGVMADAAAPRRVNVVLLGATGNLAEKYLWQGLYNIYADGLVGGEQLAVYPAATKGAEHAAPKLERILANNVTARDDASRDAFFARVSQYAQLRAEDQYAALAQQMEADTAAAGEEEAGRLLYLSVPPKFFGSIAANIDKHLRPKREGAWLRVIVEKPFGVDLPSAEALAQDLYKSLKQEEILLVDHYMGKAGLHGIREFMQTNTLDKLTTTRKLSHIEVGMLETEDCDGRTGFYDEVGVLRDTVQNHLMMMVALLAMNTTADSAEEADARKAVFEQLLPASLGRVAHLGQYASYNDHVNEDRVKWQEAPLDEPSVTPTYAHITLAVDNAKSMLHGIPIHFKSGKALNVRRSYAEMAFDDGSMLVFNLQGPARPGVDGAVVIVSPTLAEGVTFPKGWSLQEVPAVGNVAFAPDGPMAYEVLLRAGLQGDFEHFVRLDEVLESWRVWTPLLKDLESSGHKPLPYSHGTALHERSHSIDSLDDGKCED